MIAPDGPIVTYLRLFCDDAGESHFEVHELRPDRSSAGVQTVELGTGSASRHSLRILPPGWTRDWGPTSEPVLAVYISGEGLVEASDDREGTIRSTISAKGPTRS